MSGTRVYAQEIGGSGLDARYLGTVKEDENATAAALRLLKSVQRVSVYRGEVIAWGVLQRA